MVKTRGIGGRGIGGWHPFSRAQLQGTPDLLVKPEALVHWIDDWTSYLRVPSPNDDLRPIRAHSRTGRPLGSLAFVQYLEKILDRRLRPRPPGPTPRNRR